MQLNSYIPPVRNSSGDSDYDFGFGLETEYLLAEVESFQPLWYRDVTFKELNEIARSRYFPTLSFAAVDSFGMAGAPGEQPGFQGLVGSPFRVGPGVGLLSKYALLDFTRSRENEAAQEPYSKRRTKAWPRRSRSTTKYINMRIR